MKRPWARQVDGRPLPRQRQLEIDPAGGFLDALRPHGRVGGQAEQERLDAALPGQAPQPRVVRVQHRSTAGSEPGQQRALFAQHPLQGAEPFQVGRADVGDEPHVRGADLGQPRDFTGQVGAELEDRPCVPRLEVEQGEGDADLVVQVFRRFQHRKPPGQDGGGHPARAGLAVGAGDGDHRGRRALAVIGRQVPQGAGRVGHRHAGDGSGRSARPPADRRCGRGRRPGPARRRPAPRG